MSWINCYFCFCSIVFLFFDLSCRYLGTVDICDDSVPNGCYSANSIYFLHFAIFISLFQLWNCLLSSHFLICFMSICLSYILFYIKRSREPRYMTEFEHCNLIIRDSLFFDELWLVTNFVLFRKWYLLLIFTCNVSMKIRLWC